MKSVFRAVVVAGIAACFAMVSLTGCSQQQEPEEETVVEEQPSYDLVIGTESDAVVNLPITNNTEQSVVGLQFKPTDAAEYSANVMAADQTWEAGQTADVFFEGVAVEEESATPESGDAQNGEVIEASASEEPLLLSDVYDIQFTAADGSIFALHQLNLAALAGAEDIAINHDTSSGLGYLTYSEDGAEVSTLESEQHIADAAAAVAQAEAEAAAAAEAEAAAAEEAETAQQSSSSSYSSGSSSSSSSYDSVSSGSESSSAPAQQEDACIDPDDLALN